MKTEIAGSDGYRNGSLAADWSMVHLCKLWCVGGCHDSNLDIILQIDIIETLSQGRLLILISFLGRGLE